MTLREYFAQLPHDAPRQERYDRGKQKRSDVSRSSHAQLPPKEGRQDPVDILRSQDSTRVQQLLPIRYGRMSSSPFALMRGSAAVMAADLAAVTRTDIGVQACGDAHLSNFGMFASPERTLVFDVNDFDETIRASFEWDLKRLGASVALVGDLLLDSSSAGRDAARSAVEGYRETVRKLHKLESQEAWALKIDVESVLDRLKRHKKKYGDLGSATAKAARKAQNKTSLSGLEKITETVDGKRRIVSSPPLIVPVDDISTEVTPEAFSKLMTKYLLSLDDRHKILLRRFRAVDVAHKVVGVGSVGTRCFVLLLQGGDGEPLFLQIKEAGDSVLAPYVDPSPYDHPGQRVVSGQRVMQAVSDPLLGWTRANTGTAYYVRQWRDMKGSVDPLSLDSEGLAAYARLCGSALARAHGRSGDSSFIAGYIGKGDSFIDAVTKFSVGYVDIIQSDYERLTSAIDSGEIEADPDV